MAEPLLIEITGGTDLRPASEADRERLLKAEM